MNQEFVFNPTFDTKKNPNFGFLDSFDNSDYLIPGIK